METLFWKLQTLVVKREVEDKLSWKFSVRSLYFSSSRGHRQPFPANIVWRTWNLLNRCYLCKGEEEMIDPLLMHRSKARMV